MHLHPAPAPVASPGADVRAPGACATCGTPLAGDFCAACGQRMLPRLTLRALALGALSRVLDADGPLLRTVGRLLRWPERVIGDVLRGSTVPYIGPFAYMAICLALAGITLHALHWQLGNDAWIPGVAAPLFLAAAGRILFLRGRLNFAEHLVANLYLAATDYLLLIPLSLLASVLPRGTVTGWVFQAGAAAILAWHVRALARLQGGGWRAWLGALLTVPLALAAMGAALLALVSLRWKLFPPSASPPAPPPHTGPRP